MSILCRRNTDFCVVDVPNRCRKKVPPKVVQRGGFGSIWLPKSLSNPLKSDLWDIPKTLPGRLGLSRDALRRLRKARRCSRGVRGNPETRKVRLKNNYKKQMFENKTQNWFFFKKRSLNANKKSMHCYFLGFRIFLLKLSCFTSSQ